MSPAAFADIKKFTSSQKVTLDDTCPASYDYKVKCLLKKDVIIKKTKPKCGCDHSFCISDESEKRLV